MDNRSNNQLKNEDNSPLAVDPRNNKEFAHTPDLAPVTSVHRFSTGLLQRLATQAGLSTVSTAVTTTTNLKFKSSSK